MPMDDFAQWFQSREPEARVSHAEQHPIDAPDMITKAALVILHQKLNFIPSINHQYDPSFAKKEAKIGAATASACRTSTRSARARTRRAGHGRAEHQLDHQYAEGRRHQLHLGRADAEPGGFLRRIIEPAMAVSLPRWS